MSRRRRDWRGVVREAVKRRMTKMTARTRHVTFPQEGHESQSDDREREIQKKNRNKNEMTPNKSNILKKTDKKKQTTTGVPVFLCCYSDLSQRVWEGGSQLAAVQEEGWRHKRRSWCLFLPHEVERTSASWPWNTNVSLQTFGGSSFCSVPFEKNPQKPKVDQLRHSEARPRRRHKSGTQWFLIESERRWIWNSPVAASSKRRPRHGRLNARGGLDHDIVWSLVPWRPRFLLQPRSVLKQNYL